MDSQKQARQCKDRPISIVTMAFNEEGNISRLYQRTKDVLEKRADRWELVVVDNGCSDGTLNEIKRLRSDDMRVKYVSLSRNFGAQGGLVAALEHASGDLVVSMDADLQHPPELINDLLDCWEQGYDVVNTKKISEQSVSSLRRFLNKVFYKVVGTLSGIPLEDRQSDFRLLDRNALNALNALPEKDKFIRGLSHWIGFSQTTIPYTPESREIGETKFNLGNLLSFTVSGILSFSIVPLRVCFFLGAIVSISAFCYSLFIFFEYFFTTDSDMPVGFASIVIGIYFLGGVQLLGLGVIGEYLGRVLSEVHARPTYIVRESQLNELENNDKIS